MTVQDSPSAICPHGRGYLELCLECEGEGIAQEFREELAWALSQDAARFSEMASTLPRLAERGEPGEFHRAMEILHQKVQSLRVTIEANLFPHQDLA